MTKHNSKEICSDRKGLIHRHAMVVDMFHQKVCSLVTHCASYFFFVFSRICILNYGFSSLHCIENDYRCRWPKVLPTIIWPCTVTKTKANTKTIGKEKSTVYQFTIPCVTNAISACVDIVGCQGELPLLCNMNSNGRYNQTQDTKEASGKRIEKSVVVRFKG